VVPEKRKGRWVYYAVTLWAVACFAGFGALWVYANTEGDLGQPNVGWDLPEQFHAHTTLPTLVVYAHPKCPCTRATFSELQRLQRDHRGDFVTRIIFFEPYHAPRTWRETDLWHQARNMTDTEAIADPGGMISQEAGARVSGTIALYSPREDVLFWGGITPSRAHEGESPGIISLRAILEGRSPLSRSSRVYGCSLRSDAECGLEAGECEGHG